MLHEINLIVIWGKMCSAKKKTHVSKGWISNYIQWNCVEKVSKECIGN